LSHQQHWNVAKGDLRCNFHQIQIHRFDIAARRAHAESLHAELHWTLA